MALSRYTTPGPMARQSAAREHARYWNEHNPHDDRIAVASQDPPGSWGGDCIGWTVIYVARPQH